MITTKFVRSGRWRTLESFWNRTATAFFRIPGGARIRVLYGTGFLSATHQTQTLTGGADEYKKLTVTMGSIAYARIQIIVQFDTDVTYTLYPNNTQIAAPDEPI